MSGLQLLVLIFGMLNRPHYQTRYTTMPEFIPISPAHQLLGMQGRVDGALTQWILDERVLFSFVMSPGFQQFTHTLNPSYKIPHRTTVRKRVLLYSSIRDFFFTNLPFPPPVFLHCRSSFLDSFTSQ